MPYPYIPNGGIGRYPMGVLSVQFGLLSIRLSENTRIALSFQEPEFSVTIAFRPVNPGLRPKIRSFQRRMRGSRAPQSHHLNTGLTVPTSTPDANAVLLRVDFSLNGTIGGVDTLVGSSISGQFEACQTIGAQCSRLLSDTA